MQTALYYLLYINPEYKSDLTNKQLIEEYFEKFYFARKKFLVNFLSRKQGLRWNGRFKKLLRKFKKDHIVDMIKTAKEEPQPPVERDNDLAAVLGPESNENHEYMSRLERKRQREQKLNREIEQEMDNLFKPLEERFKVS